MLKIENLKVSVDNQEILKGIDLVINPGEVHAIMGPNGAGKSTLSSVLVGKPGYVITHGEVTFFGESILSWTPEERACAGLFLAFQYPIEIPGVSNTNFLKTAVNAMRKKRGEVPLDAVAFLSLLKEKAKLVKIDPALLHRAVNEGFSGGEKKRNEILQMAVLNPKIAILDETDSGLDIDALRTVAEGVNQLRTPDRAIIMITHYQRLLDYIMPDHVHILYKGRIVQTGSADLAQKIEKRGYNWLQEVHTT